MVATYGVARENDADATYREGSDESRALLGGTSSSGTPAAPNGKRDGHATMMSCIGNLANTIIGSGMLTFPLAMASAGIIPGVVTCITSGTVAAFGLYLLSLCATYTGHRRSSFHAVSQLTFPRAAVFFDAAIAIKCFGVSISYLIIVKSLMPNVVASLYHDFTGPDTNPPDWAMNGRNWITIFMVVLIPLAYMKHLNSLRYTSYVALFTVAYLVCIVIKCYFWPLKGMPERGEVTWFKLTPNFISTFPIQVFGFTCAQNLFPIYNEVKDNSQKRLNIVIGTSIGGAVITYEVVAIIGYLTFGSVVGPNIIAMYPSTSLFVAMGQLAIVINFLCSYPLQVHPCRNCLDKVLNPDHSPHAEVKAQTPNTAVTVAADEEDEEEVDEDEHAHVAMSPLRHTVLTSLIVASGFTIAYLVDDLQLVLSFVGSTGSTTISFILPGLFYWKLTRNDPTARTTNLLSICLTVYGVLIFIFCLSFNIYKVIHPSQPGQKLE
ncbi:vacuolar amino acid transporter 5 [Coprinopsis sp. MPI-PUGE-AT-0042]|nr:vacuolar amino acid transporter 5 [Coprinopsis sp. MPI-PUGE-AT-0042]